MNHPAEIALHQFMENASNGKSKFSDETVAQVGKDVMDAVKRQFGSSKPRGDFRLRMSNIHDVGRYCGSCIQRIIKRSRSQV